MAAAVVAGLAVVAAGVSAYATYDQGQRAERIADENAQTARETAAQNRAIAEKNLAISEQEAAAIEAQGRKAAEMKRREVGRLLAYQRTQESITGFKYSGTAIDVAEQSAAEGEQDVATIWSNAVTAANLTRSRGKAQALGAGYAANNLDKQAGFYQQQSEDASQAGVFGAGSTLLTGLSRAYSGYYTGSTITGTKTVKIT